MRIVFMGTPDFAVVQLAALIDAGHDILAVFCQNDKPKGRHQEMTPPDVKIFAQQKGIAVYQPKTLKDENQWQILKELAPEIIVVAAYGKLLPQEVLDIPKYGCINVHGSLLPKLRGASPIQRAIINGDEFAGVTIMKMALGMDTGDMLLKKSLKIGEDETAQQLFDRLADLGAQAVVEAIEKIETLAPEKQNEEDATWASPLSKEDGFINFSLSAFLTYRKFLGTYPWPGAYFLFNGKRVKILEMEKSFLSGKMGEILDKNFTVGCKEGSVVIKKVAPEGKKPMDGISFMNGQRLKKGDMLL